MDVAEAARACAAPGIVLTHRAGAAGFLGYVRRRDRIANEKIAAAAGRTMREVISTAFVAVRTMWAA